MNEEEFRARVREVVRQDCAKLPPLTDEQNRGLTLIAAQYAARKRREARDQR